MANTEPTISFSIKEDREKELKRTLTTVYEALLEKGILSKCEYGFKVLGNGKVTKKVTVEASAFSASAKEAIEAAGGKAEVI